MDQLVCLFERFDIISILTNARVRLRWDGQGGVVEEDTTRMVLKDLLRANYNARRETVGTRRKHGWINSRIIERLSEAAI